VSRLAQLAAKYGTDKLEHGYCPHYERELPTNPESLLEIGIWEGASLRMWREFFPHPTRIMGVDKYDRGVHIDGVTTWLADQADARGLTGLGIAADRLDVIIDDASHLSSLTIQTFKQLWPFLRPGGVYVVEDLQTSYDVEHYGAEASSTPDNTHTAMAFCKRLADQTNRRLLSPQYDYGYAIAAVAFYPNICFVRKAAADD